jgi:Uma2 family endonuclease
LVDGELREIDGAAKSQYVAGEIYAHLRNFIKPRRLGWAFPPESSFACFADDPNRLRKPDAAFVAAPDCSVEEIDRSSYIKAVPVLVAEVVSPHDTVYESEAKRDQWLNAGVKVV